MTWIVTKTLGALAALLLPSSAALACAVCGGGKEESRVAFLMSTALMSAVPLAGIGSLIYFLYKKSRE